MPNGYLFTLWNMWMSEIITVTQIIQILKTHGYELVCLTKENVKIEKPGETFEYYNYK